MLVKEPGMKHKYTTYNQYKSEEVLKLKNNTAERLYSIAIHTNNFNTHNNRQQKYNKEKSTTQNCPTQ